MPLVEIKDFNALIYKKSFFDQPVKSKPEAYEKRIKVNYICITNLLVLICLGKQIQVFLKKLVLQEN